MTDAEDLTFDEEAAMEAAREINAVPHLRDILKREQDERLKGRPRNARVEKRLLEIEEMIVRDLEKK